MQPDTHVVAAAGEPSRMPVSPGDPCLVVIFGASGDLTRRLLMPAFFNLACAELLSKHFAIAGIALDALSTEQFRARMTENIKQFSTRKEFDRAVWIELVNRLYYTPGDFSDPEAYRRLADLVAKLETKYQTGGNIVIYLATPPSVFGLISTNLERVGFKNESAAGFGSLSKSRSATISRPRSPSTRRF